MTCDDEYYPILILDALRHIRYWMRKMGLSLEQRKAIWRFMERNER